jgi:RNA 3'-terminal phosphate cyclase (ATP)
VDRTAIWVAEQLTDAKFEVEEQAGGQFIIHCEGIEYTASPAGTPSDVEE